MKYIYCPHCGKQIKSSNRFCPYCGNQINISNNNVKSSVMNFYRNHKIMTIITVILLIIIGGSAIHHHNHEKYIAHEYPSHQLPPMIANQQYTFSGNAKLIMHKKTFTFRSSENGNNITTAPDTKFYYRVTHVSYDLPYIRMNVEYTGNNINPLNQAGDVVFNKWLLKVHKNHIVSSPYDSYKLSQQSPE